jgi:hypothetical protein
MRKTVGPFLATGVVLVAATAIVANPLVTSPPDKFISTAEWAADGDGQDPLGFGFLKSIGPAHQFLPAPIAGLEELLNGLINSAPSISASGTETSPLPVVELPDQALGEHATSASSVDHAAAAAIPGAPSESVQAAITAITNIGNGTGVTGAKLIEQLGVAPAVVFSLLGQVLDGTLSPEEALRRLIAAPLAAVLTGFPDLTGDPQIDALFADGSLRPLLDALIANLPTPIGQDGGAIDAIDRGLTRIATQIRDRLDPSLQRNSSSPPADVDLPVTPALIVNDGQPDQPPPPSQPTPPRQPAAPGSAAPGSAESDSNSSAPEPGVPQPPRAVSQLARVPSEGASAKPAGKADAPGDDNDRPTLNSPGHSAPGSPKSPRSDSAPGGTGGSPSPASSEN